jgi:hypothetical protein
MFGLINILFALVLCGAPALQAQTPAAADARQQRQQTPPQAPTQSLPLMREYRGVKLGRNRARAGASRDGLGRVQAGRQRSDDRSLQR